jgi:hypothetical protein
LHRHRAAGVICDCFYPGTTNLVRWPKFSGDLVVTWLEIRRYVQLPLLRLCALLGDVFIDIAKAIGMRAAVAVVYVRAQTHSTCLRGGDVVRERDCLSRLRMFGIDLNETKISPFFSGGSGSGDGEPGAAVGDAQHGVALALGRIHPLSAFPKPVVAVRSPVRATMAAAAVTRTAVVRPKRELRSGVGASGSWDGSAAAGAGELGSDIDRP